MQQETAQVIQFFSALAITLIGFTVNQVFQKKPKLITFFAHTSELTLKNSDGSEFKTNTNTPIVVRSHTVRIGNIGKSTANEIKIIHGILPVNYTIYPPIHYEKHDKEIMIPSLSPGEFIAITYLYFTDIHISQTTILVKCKECLAVPGNMQHVHLFPQWFIAICYFLLFVGAVTTVYFAIGIIICFYNGCINKLS